MKLIRNTIIALAALTIFTSCAKDISYSSDFFQQRIRDAWLRLNYPTLTADEFGLYRLSYEAGTGAKPSEDSYVRINLNTLDLDGNYSSTTYADLAKKLGNFNDSSHYVPKTVRLNNYETYDVIEKELCSISEGSKIKLLIPPELTYISYPVEYLKYYGLTNVAQSKTNEIYEIELVEAIEDMDQYQVDKLCEFGYKNYPDIFKGALDSLSFGLYTYKLKTNPNEADTIPQGTVVELRYVGKLLDNYCFDTNIADTAKFYRHYSPDYEYEPLEVSYYTNYSQIIEASSVVSGFAQIFSTMKYDEVAIGFFRTELGYSDKGSGLIDPYEPLFFMIVTPENPESPTTDE